MIQYKYLSMVLQLRSGEMFPLTLRSLSLPENPTIDDFRRALLNTELACHPYYAYLQRFCRFGYSTDEPQVSNGMLYIRPLRDDFRLQELLHRHQQEGKNVTFYIEQTRSMKNEPCNVRAKSLKEGEVIPCNGSRLSNMSLILEASAFSSNSSSSLDATSKQGPSTCPETYDDHSKLTSSPSPTGHYNDEDTCGDIFSIEENHCSEPMLSLPCPASMMNPYCFQEPYVIPYMTPMWQCHGYWVFPPFYIPLPNSLDMSSNCNL
ncbi:hypothetical protein GpartN1_g4720.t1 [Galdieria partita]|uniref:Uncharacterized protein n=1 Tax=Galdieria partita TaxID=83374 RepID=A0A9C7PYJ5_9RHOD|nr:hypothetical protein GpartN1_g4720.t1 [Galdieria partita]